MTGRPSRRPERSERGATAVIVGILAVLLFSFAALAVDMGNAWARKRAVQTQVDVSAIAAGSLLPMTALNKTAIADRVASYLNENQANGQVDVTGAQLIDTTASNGEIYFQDSDGAACVTSCNRMQVLAPQAQVEFGFARVMGFERTAVQRTALPCVPPVEVMMKVCAPDAGGVASSLSGMPAFAAAAAAAASA